MRIIAATNRDLQPEIEGGRSARTSTTGSTSSPSRSRRCASARRHPARSRSFFLGRYAQENGQARSRASPTTRCAALAAYALAGQRARARERHRARRGALRRPAHRGEAPAADARPASGARRGAARSRIDHPRSRALRDPEDPRSVRRLDVEGGARSSASDAQDSVQAPRVRRGRVALRRERPSRRAGAGWELGGRLARP